MSLGIQAAAARPFVRWTANFHFYKIGPNVVATPDGSRGLYMNMNWDLPCASYHSYQLHSLSPTPRPAIPGPTPPKRRITQSPHQPMVWNLNSLSLSGSPRPQPSTACTGTYPTTSSHTMVSGSSLPPSPNYLLRIGRHAQVASGHYYIDC